MDPEVKLPVLVYFHGGAFLYGSAGNHKPIYILEKDIILVTPQYRLGALGLFRKKKKKKEINKFNKVLRTIETQSYNTEIFKYLKLSLLGVIFFIIVNLYFKTSKLTNLN